MASTIAGLGVLGAAYLLLKKYQEMKLPVKDKKDFVLDMKSELDKLKAEQNIAQDLIIKGEQENDKLKIAEGEKQQKKVDEAANTLAKKVTAEKAKRESLKKGADAKLSTANDIWSTVNEITYAKDNLTLMESIESKIASFKSDVSLIIKQFTDAEKELLPNAIGELNQIHGYLQTKLSEVRISIASLKSSQKSAEAKKAEAERKEKERKRVLQSINTKYSVVYRLKNSDEHSTYYKALSKKIGAYSDLSYHFSLNHDGINAAGVLIHNATEQINSVTSEEKVVGKTYYDSMKNIKERYEKGLAILKQREDSLSKKIQAGRDAEAGRIRKETAASEKAALIKLADEQVSLARQITNTADWADNNKQWSRKWRVETLNETELPVEVVFDAMKLRATPRWDSFANSLDILAGQYATQADVATDQKQRLLNIRNAFKKEWRAIATKQYDSICTFVATVTKYAGYFSATSAALKNTAWNVRNKYQLWARDGKDTKQVKVEIRVVGRGLEVHAQNNTNDPKICWLGVDFCYDYSLRDNSIYYSLVKGSKTPILLKPGEHKIIDRRDVPPLWKKGVWMLASLWNSFKSENGKIKMVWPRATTREWAVYR